jgi:hypothetical protein
MICPWCEKETEVQDGFCLKCGLEIPEELLKDCKEETVKKYCSSCNGNMSLYGTQTIQLGSYGFFTGHLDNLLSGGLEVDIYMCKKCRKLEFYALDKSYDVK